MKTLSKIDGEFGINHKIAIGTFDNNNEFAVILDWEKSCGFTTGMEQTG